MKALYYEKPLRENASIREMPDPVCGSHDIVIRVMSCSICHGVEADHEAPGGSSCSGYPLIPGHEFAGYVHEVGDAVTTFRVTGSPPTTPFPAASAITAKKVISSTARTSGTWGTRRTAASRNM